MWPPSVEAQDTSRDLRQTALIIGRLNDLESVVNRCQEFMEPEAFVEYRRLLDRLARAYGLVWEHPNGPAL